MMKGQVEAVIFDWAGTVVDFGSCAPMGAFVEVFGRFGVEISMDEARIPMGLPKWDHIHALLSLPRVAGAWEATKGRPFTREDVDEIYAVFVPLNADVAAEHSALIPGVADLVRALRAAGMKIGSTTGYTRGIMERVLPRASEQGFDVDTLVCAGDLPSGRPGPLMMYKVFVDLDLRTPHFCVKVDDTEPGIAEGLAAGTWTVGVSVSGNALGLSVEEFENMAAEELLERQDEAEASLVRTGAHYVIDTVADLMPVLDDIEGRLRRGERP